MLNSLENFIGDYCSSEHFLFLDPVLKEYAEPLLHDWLKHKNADGSPAALEPTLKRMAQLDLPLDVRKGIPVLLKAFFSFLESTGKVPDAGHWSNAIAQVEEKYLAGFRGDGTTRGETYKKKYSDTGRNEPCPCGSGKKFKKCCMQLFA